MTFSSYPGTILSADDYYLINSGLVSANITVEPVLCDIPREQWNRITIEPVLCDLPREQWNRITVEPVLCDLPREQWNMVT